MKRFLSTLKIDATIQLRNQLYSIGIFVALFVAVALSQLARPDQLGFVVPTLMLLVVGGTTLLYVAGMLIFERDEGTINMVIVSPLRTSEYLWSKVISLSALAMLEAIVMVGGAMLIMRFSGKVPLPNIPILLLGILTIGIIYTLIGIVMIVRFDKITDFLMPMAFAAVFLQLPFLYFLGIVNSWLFLIVPTSASTVLMQGAYRPLAAWEWVYSIGYTTVLIVVLAVWAHRAFEKHIVQQVG